MSVSRPGLPELCRELWRPRQWGVFCSRILACHRPSPGTQILVHHSPFSNPKITTWQHNTARIGFSVLFRGQTTRIAGRCRPRREANLPAAEKVLILFLLCRTTIRRWTAHWPSLDGAVPGFRRPVTASGSVRPSPGNDSLLSLGSATTYLDVVKVFQVDRCAR